MTTLDTILESPSKDLLENPLLRRELVEARAYQMNIAGAALKKNTLVVLPTALGKTIIAALAAAKLLQNHRDMKILVMAPTKPLVLQHRDTFAKLLKLRERDFEVLTGKTTQSQRLEVWNGPAKIFFATPQVVNNDCGRGINLKDFGLLVFDECHRARKNYAYTKVAEAYVGGSQYPMILAMTASPGSDGEKVRDLCKSLYIENVEVRSEDDPDVKPYMSPVGVEWKFVNLPESYAAIRSVIKKMLERRLNSLATMRVIRKDPRFIFRNDLVEAGAALRRRLGHGGQRGSIFGAIMLQSSALTLYHALELLESQGPNSLKKFLDRVREGDKKSHRSVATELESNNVFESLELLEEHPKMGILEKVVKDQISSSPQSKIIIFTQYRDTSSRIVELLSEAGILAKRFVGQASKDGEDGMTQDQQAERLRKFRDGDVKVLVATSIGEEGLDIPNVDLVLFYEPVPSEIRYIQRKGRTGRGNVGKVLILAAAETLDMSYLRSSGKKVEKMRRMIKKLNTELSPVLRLGQPPQLNPISAEEIFDGESCTPLEETEELKDVERTKAKKFNRDVRRVAKDLLHRVLQSGEVSLDDFGNELEKGGVDKSVMQEAVKQLLTSKQVNESGGKIFPLGVDDFASKKFDSHNFEVERVLVGGAVLMVDEKWRTILRPECYDGPRELIKKGIKFRAKADFYKLDGKLHARIHSIESTYS